MFEKILTKIANYKGDFEGLSAIIKDTCEELKIAKLESFFYEQNAKEQPACVLYAATLPLPKNTREKKR